VKPTTFKQVLNDSKATLAEVLKPSIAGENGGYDVYVTTEVQGQKQLQKESHGGPPKKEWVPSMSHFAPEDLPLYEVDAMALRSLHLPIGCQK